MGRRDLNPHIGKISFASLDIVTEQDDRTCYDNCVLVRKECGALGIISSAIRMFKNSLKCPLEYYNCTRNIVYTKKLISGFYVDQKMYGTEIVKPQNRKKCSHGNQNGIFYKPYLNFFFYFLQALFKFVNFKVEYKIKHLI
jgi:hypothetical protein